MTLSLSPQLLVSSKAESFDSLLVPYGFESQFEQSYLENISDELMNDSEDSSDLSKGYSRFLVWLNQEQNYQRGVNICREQNGNVICLTPESARYLRW